MPDQPQSAHKKFRNPKTRRPPAPPNALVVTLAEFCRLAGFSPASVRKRIGEGMPCIKVDRHVRVEPERALQWLRERTAKVQTTESAS